MAKDTTKAEQTNEELNQGVGASSQGPAPETKEETTDMAKTPQWGGFKVEVGVDTPKAGTSKYDWASFPAPSDPNDPKTWTSVFIPDIGGKTIYSSIKTYRDKIQKEGGRAPEFTVSVSKEPKGVRVIRKS